MPVNVALRFRSLSGIANAAAAGIGLARLPGITIQDPAYKDVLTPVLKDFSLGETPYMWCT